jgi:hypothetical protein
MGAWPCRGIPCFHCVRGSCHSPRVSTPPLVSVDPKVTRAVFEAANGGLKVVGRAGVGVDNVDLGAATEVRPLSHSMRRCQRSPAWPPLHFTFPST